MAGPSAAFAAPPRAARRRARTPTPSHAPTGVRSGSVRTRIDFDHLGPRTVDVAYEAHGPADAPATVVLGGISAGRRIAPTASDPARAWWPGVVKQGGALDPARQLLIGIDFLGGANDDGPLRPVTTHDQARAVAAALEELGACGASFVGASYGGMVALAFAELFPARTARLVVLCAAHRTHPMATGVRAVQRAAARLGADCGQPARGLALARALAMTTYRSPHEFEARFACAPLHPGRPGRSPARFPVEGYLDARGGDFARRFDPERFLALSESIDLHRTAPESLPPDALLVSFDTDALVPPWLVDELATRSGRRPRHVAATSLYGHDAFLKEVGLVESLLQASLPRTPEAVR